MMYMLLAKTQLPLLKNITQVFSKYVNKVMFSLTALGFQNKPPFRGAKKKQVPFSMAIGNVEHIHECVYCVYIAMHEINC